MVRLVFVALLCCCWLSTARSDEYPSRPIHLVVGFAPGGGTDTFARILAQAMSERLGVSVVVDNRPGATGAIAGRAVASAAPDGYTVWLATQGPLVVAPLIQHPVPYDPVADFSPVSLLTTVSLLVAVTDKFPARTFPELVRILKTSDQKYPYATAGTGGPGHLAAELLSRTAGVEMLHVPYPGDGAAIPNILSGDVPIWFTSPASAIPQLGAGGIRILATTGTVRETMLPDIPTISESGYPDYAAVSFNAMLLPKRAPANVIKKLNETVKDIYANPIYAKKIEGLGYVPVVSSSSEATEYIRKDIAKWKDVLSFAKLVPQ